MSHLLLVELQLHYCWHFGKLSCQNICRKKQWIKEKKGMVIYEYHNILNGFFFYIFIDRFYKHRYIKPTKTNNQNQQTSTQMLAHTTRREEWLKKRFILNHVQKINNRISKYLLYVIFICNPSKWRKIGKQTSCIWVQLHCK